MGNPRGFLELEYVHEPKRDPAERVRDHRMIFDLMPVGQLREQADRCMNCGIPFCHHACPVGNRIPRWNELVTREDWQGALEQLHATNNFPEFTGYICPAPCQAACVLEINDDPVTIKQIELQIIDTAWDNGWVQPRPPAVRTGKRVAVVAAGLRNGGGVDRQRASEMQANLELAVGLLLDLLDDDVHALDGGNRR